MPERDRGFGQPTRASMTPTGNTFDPVARLEAISANELPALDERLRGELGLIQGIADQTGVEDAVTRSQEQSDRFSSVDEAQFERATRGFDMSARQKRGANRRLGLSRTVNRASAAGATRRGFADRAKAAESTGGSFADAFFGQRLSGETSLAVTGAEAQAARTGRRADKQAGMLRTAGQVIGTAFAFFSSEDLKHDRGREPQLLNKLKKVRVNRWQYKGDDETHVGPFSEEFNREFGIKTKRPDMINVIDALGVTLGAVKELNEKVEARG